MWTQSTCTGCWYCCLRVFGRNNGLFLSVLLLGKKQHETRLALAAVLIMSILITNHLFCLLVADLHYLSMCDCVCVWERERVREREREREKLTYIHLLWPLGCYSPWRLQGDRGNERLTEVCHQDHQRQLQGKHCWTVVTTCTARSCGNTPFCERPCLIMFSDMGTCSLYKAFSLTFSPLLGTCSYKFQCLLLCLLYLIYLYPCSKWLSVILCNT